MHLQMHFIYHVRFPVFRLNYGFGKLILCMQKFFCTHGVIQVQGSNYLKDMPLIQVFCYKKRLDDKVWCIFELTPFIEVRNGDEQYFCGPI